jgi:hypothetical protein
MKKLQRFGKRLARFGSYTALVLILVASLHMHTAWEVSQEPGKLTQLTGSAVGGVYAGVEHQWQRVNGAVSETFQEIEWAFQRTMLCPKIY